MFRKDIISDQDYIEAFNQGYELARELGLESDILKGLASGNNRITAMQEGMQLFEAEMSKEKDKNIIPPLDIDSMDLPSMDLDNSGEKSKDKDKDLDIGL